MDRIQAHKKEEESVNDRDRDVVSCAEGLRGTEDKSAITNAKPS